jgi:octaprenyl-diphosphate synthase
VELVREGDLEVLRALSNATNAMTVGEMRQLGAVDALSFSEADYEALIRAKTASLLSAACEIGALAGAIGYRRQLSAYGEALGMAFQVADDLLDYTVPESVTGKPSGLDLKEHKVTLPLIAALRTMPSSARAEVEALFADAAPDEDHVARVAGIVEENGGFEFARRSGERYARVAEAALEGLPVTPAVSALHYVLDRRH